MTIKRLILDYEAGDLYQQVRAAHACRNELLKEGDLCGVQFDNGKSFGVVRNKESLRVYPQQGRNEHGEQKESADRTVGTEAR
jgi:hypothetical protein